MAMSLVYLLFTLLVILAVFFVSWRARGMRFALSAALLSVIVLFAGFAVLVTLITSSMG